MIVCLLVQSTTMERKLDVHFRPYTILGACNPPLAHRALAADLEIGLLLPCNVVVYERDGGSRVEFLDPVKALDVVGNEKLNPVAEEARERLLSVAHALEAGRQTPLYAFCCTGCGHQFDRLISLRDGQDAVRCLECESTVRRLITTFATSADRSTERTLLLITGG